MDQCAVVNVPGLSLMQMKHSALFIMILDDGCWANINDRLNLGRAEATSVENVPCNAT